MTIQNADNTFLYTCRLKKTMMENISILKAPKSPLSTISRSLSWSLSFIYLAIFGLIVTMLFNTPQYQSSMNYRKTYRAHLQISIPISWDFSNNLNDKVRRWYNFDASESLLIFWFLCYRKYFMLYKYFKIGLFTGEKKKVSLPLVFL